MREIALAAFLLFHMLCSAYASAALVPVLKVDADYFAGISYQLGLDLDEHHLIRGLTFREGTGKPVYYLLERLQNFVTIFNIKGVNAVRLRIFEQTSPTDATIELSYIKNGIFQTHGVIYFDVTWNAQKSSYEIIDTRTNEVITKAHVYTRYAGPVPIGILSIDTE